MQMVIEQGWSCDALRFRIQSQLRARTGAAPSNFAEVLPLQESEVLPLQESDQAQQPTKDPYVLEVGP